MESLNIQLLYKRFKKLRTCMIYVCEYHGYVYRYFTSIKTQG